MKVTLCFSKQWMQSFCKMSKDKKECTRDFFVSLFVCLLWGGVVPLKNFSHIWRSYHYWRRAANLTYTRNSCQLDSECSSACHTYCDTGHPFIIVTSNKWALVFWHGESCCGGSRCHRGPVTLSPTNCFYDLSLSERKWPDVSSCHIIFTDVKTSLYHYQQRATKLSTYGHWAVRVL